MLIEFVSLEKETSAAALFTLVLVFELLAVAFVAGA